MQGVDFKTCADKEGMDMGSMGKLKSGEADADTKKKFGCVVKCFMEKQGMWKNGGADAAGIESQASSSPFLKNLSNAKENIAECAAKKGSDDCDTAYQVAMCFMSKMKPKN